MADLTDDDICAFQHALQQLEWIASGTTPGRDCDLYDDRVKANIRHAIAHAESALRRFRPAYARLIAMHRDRRKSNADTGMTVEQAFAVEHFRKYPGVALFLLKRQIGEAAVLAGVERWKETNGCIDCTGGDV